MQVLLFLIKFALIYIFTSNVLCIKQSQLINLYVLTTDNLNKQLIIDDNTLIGKPFNVSLKPYHISVNERIQQLNTKCLFYGQIDSPNKVQAIVSLSNCTNVAFGVITIDGNTYTLNQNGNVSHNGRVKRELSARQMQLIRHDNVGVCGNALREPTPEWFIKRVESLEPRDDLNVNFGDGMVELAVYVDRLMLSYHFNDRHVMNQFVVISVAYAQTVFHQSNIEKHLNINLTIKHFEMIDIQNINKYSINEVLRHFCRHRFVNRTVADISLLFSGANLWFSPKGEITSSVLGLANVYSVCKQKMNCLVLEGRNLKSPLTLAHEIGHMFGMFHDGDKKRGTFDCSEYTHIMSPTISGGKTEWSECSVRQMRQFFLSLKKDNKGRLLCFQQYSLAFDPYFSIDNTKALRPGLTVDIHKQCQMSFGKGFFAYVDRNTQNICKSMYCWSKVLVVMGHPALEGTKCAKNKYCTRGQCVAGKY